MKLVEKVLQAKGAPLILANGLESPTAFGHCIFYGLSRFLRVFFGSKGLKYHWKRDIGREGSWPRVKANC